MQVIVVLDDKELLWNCPQQSRLLSLQQSVSSTCNLNAHDFMIIWKDEGDDIPILREDDMNIALNVSIKRRNGCRFHIMKKVYPVYPTTYTNQQQKTDERYQQQQQQQQQPPVQAQRGESSETNFGESLEFTPIFEENNNKELLSLLTSSVNDETLITRIELDNIKYFILEFKAIQYVFTKVMLNKLGFNVIKPLFVHCNNKQKLILINDLCHNIVPIASDKYGYLSIKTIINILCELDNNILIKYLICSLIDNVKILSSVECGVRLLVDVFDNKLKDDNTRRYTDYTNNFFIHLAFATVKHTNILIKHQYGWFVLYKFLRTDAPILVTNQIKEAIINKYHEYCKYEWASKVVEQCLRHSIHITKTESKDFATIIVKEILTAPDDLIDHQYGKHLFHLALLTQVNGINGNNLETLKNEANKLYEKHIKQVRTKSSSNLILDDVSSESEEEEEHYIYTSNFDIIENDMKNDVLEYMAYPQFS